MLMFWTVMVVLVAIIVWIGWYVWSQKRWIPLVWKILIGLGLFCSTGILGREYETSWGPLWCLTVGVAMMLFAGIMTFISEIYRNYKKNQTVIKARENHVLRIQSHR
jgi:hypothetical protein